MSPAQSPTIRLGHFVARCAYDHIPSQVLEKAAMCLLDGFGLALLSSDERTSMAVRALAIPAEGPGTARLWVGGLHTAVSSAVLANAISIHAQFHDDTDYSSWTHPGSLIVSVAASLGDAVDAPLDLVLRGIVAGYDALVWLGAEERLARAMIGRGVRTSPTLGAVGAAATAAVILRLDELAAANAIGIASSLAGGVLEPVKVGSDEWRVQNGQAACGGLLAAQLAAHGVVGAASGLEGSKGLAHSFGGLDTVPEWGADPRVDAILGIVAKPWATLGDNMAAAAAAKLVHEDGLDLTRFKDIKVRIWRPYSEYPGTAYRGPFHQTAQALASTVFATSAMLVTGGLEYEVSRDRREDPEILRLAAMTTVEADDGGGPMDGSIEITFDDGTVRRRTSREAPTTLLYHDRPTSTAVFESRLRRRGRPVGEGSSLAKSVFATIDSADSIDLKFFLDRLIGKK